MPIVSASNLRKSFNHRVILDGVSLTVRTGDRIGVVGVNGSGKTTLGAILAGLVEPDSGTVALRRGARVAYLPQDPRFGESETVGEAVLSGLGEWNAAKARYDRAVAALDREADRHHGRAAAGPETAPHLGGSAAGPETAPHPGGSAAGPETAPHPGATAVDRNTASHLGGTAAAGGRERTVKSTSALGAGADMARWVAEQAAAAEEVERQGGWERLHEAESILGRLGVGDVDARVNDLSVGRRRAVALSKVLVARPALAILDEPTNHLDVATIEWLEGYLVDEYRGALFLITHDRYVLDRVATRTVEIDGGALYGYEGGYEQYLEAKAERSAQAERTEANRRNFLRQELDWLRRGPKARTGKQKARIQRAEQAIAVEAPAERRIADLSLAATRTGKSLLDIEGLHVEAGGEELIAGLNLGLVPGERIGIVGPNGCGKTTLLRTIVGELQPSRGTVTVGKNTRVAYLDQMRGGLNEQDTVEENIAGTRAYLEIAGRSLSVRSYLERFLFDPAAARMQVASLSGGERARVALAKLLASAANLLVLDEPTNDLDVATLTALESMILDFSGTALIVSHDRWFLDRLATSIIAFEPSGRVLRYEGNYSEYRESLAAREAAAEAAQRAESAQRTASAQRDDTGADDRTRPGGGKGEQAAAGKPRKLTYAERIELEGLMPSIEAAEEEVTLLEAKLADPGAYSSGAEAVKELLRKLEEAKAREAKLIERWEELEAKRG